MVLPHHLLVLSSLPRPHLHFDVCLLAEGEAFPALTSRG